MDNIKISKEKNCFIIKKGNISRKYFVMYHFFNFFLVILFSTLFQIGILEGDEFISTLILIEIAIWWICIFLVGFSFHTYKNFYLEIINIDINQKKIILKGPQLNFIFSFQELIEIKVFSKKDISIFKTKTFQDFCTLEFIIRDRNSYLWGFCVSQKKAEELKIKIENWMKEGENGNS